VVVVCRTKNERLIRLEKIHNFPQESNSENLASLASPVSKKEVYPLLSKDYIDDAKGDANLSSPKVSVTDDTKDDANLSSMTLNNGSPKFSVISETISGEWFDVHDDAGDANDAKFPALDSSGKIEKPLETSEEIIDADDF
jgi:hypothetical protein